MSTIAIDFGTSNTVVSIIEPDTKEIKILRFAKFSRQFNFNDNLISVIPSLVFIADGNQFILGEEVRSQRLKLLETQRFFKGFKKELVTDFQPPPRRINGNLYTAKMVAESFLKQIFLQIKQQKILVSELIFTVPVGSFTRYLDWLRELGNNLEIENLTIIDESTAAALGYAVKQPGSLVLVIDFGGGTLDLSLVKIKNNFPDNNYKIKQIKAEVIAKSDAYIGGEDIDRAIVEDYLKSQNISREQIGEIGWQNLLEIAEKLKIELSRSEFAKQTWFDDNSFIAYELELNRDRLETILEEYQFLELLRETLDDIINTALAKGISKKEIQRVILVGGTCLIPAVRQLIISYFGKQKVSCDRPFDAVARGALSLTKITSVQDYLRHAYAIRLWQPQTKNYTYFNLFEKGTKYPCKSKAPLILQAAIAGQKEIRLDIGEVAEIFRSEVTFDSSQKMSATQLLQEKTYRSLNTHQKSLCIARLDPPGVEDLDRISVQFEVDEKRILIATIEDLLTNKILVNKKAIAQLN